MEQQGIGRPSTYAPTVKLLLDRNYAQTENGTILPTLRGEQTLDYLVEICPDVFSVHFTAEMEEQLDQIASGLSRSLEVISFFYYQKLAPSLQAATAALLRSRQTGEVCPQCGGSLIHQRGKHGPTVACANWPQCAYTRSASAGHHKTQPAS